MIISGLKILKKEKEMEIEKESLEDYQNVLYNRIILKLEKVDLARERIKFQMRFDNEFENPNRVYIKISEGLDEVLKNMERIEEKFVNIKLRGGSVGDNV
jgi:hypothetical protein